MTALDIAKLESEAVRRITSAQDVARIAGDLAILVRTLPTESAQKLYGAFLLMAEVQSELLTADSLPTAPAPEQPMQEQRTLIDVNIERCAALLRSLSHVEARQRAQIVMTRMGCSKSAFYRYRTAAIESGLL
jgi:hypothetical protein